jgi:2-methylisocitrate lyase-like PEP mutase family enzyme
MRYQERAVAFRRLHTEAPLVLPNAWDAGSARVIERAGAQAIATTSAGVAWAHGCPDGQHLSREELLQALRAIVRAVAVPVTADIEGGYGNGSSADVAETVRAVIDAGVVGVNLEDSPGHSGAALLAVEAQAERIRAARAAGGPELFINARTDVYLLQVGAPEERFAEVVRRAVAYCAAGADGIFVPGVTDVETVGALVQAIDAPLNIMVGPGAPPVARLAKLGVRRVSSGPALSQLALTVTQQAAYELLIDGTYSALEQGLPFATVNGLFSAQASRQ